MRGPRRSTTLMMCAILLLPNSQYQGVPFEAESNLFEIGRHVAFAEKSQIAAVRCRPIVGILPRDFGEIGAGAQLLQQLGGRGALLVFL